MKMTRAKAIKFLEHLFHLPLSKEQLAIVHHNYRTPTLVNACAGSGKTTLLLFNIVLSIITHEYASQSILGITFSKRAQLDMAHKYNQAIKTLYNHNVPSIGKQPTFRTFDSLFLRLLKIFPKYENIKVLTSYTRIIRWLYPALVCRPKGISAKGEMKYIFRFYNLLISQHYSYNGYQLLGHNDTNVLSLSAIAESVGIKRNPKFFKNYISVAKRYNEVKHQKHLVDFNDIKILLLKKIRDVYAHKRILKYMSKYQLCFIDEFQDINPLDWKIILSILSKKTLNKLVAIGDDDQSIYAFRGSDPRIILNFTKKYPNAKRFNLSTNYRTNSHVLNTVKPLIENNKYRMTKELKASHTLQGGVYRFDSNRYSTSGDLLLFKVLTMYQSPSCKDGDVAVLVRYNSDKMLATDWFANYGIYINSDYVLQQNYIYRAIINIAIALCYDDIGMLKPDLKFLGFQSYRQHFIKMIKKLYSMTDFLSQFLRRVNLYNKYNNLTGKNYAVKDKAILDTVAFIHGRQGIPASKKLERIFNLTNNYFSYMASNNFISKVVYKSIKNYLLREASHYVSLMSFLGHENTKKQHFRYLSRNKKNRFPILTIHQSKGLQFKYVFLYNLTDRNVALRMQKCNQYFAPNISVSQFIKKLLKMSSKQLKDADSRDQADLTEAHQEPTPYENIRNDFNGYKKKIKKSYKKTHPNGKPKDKHDISFTELWHGYLHLLSQKRLDMFGKFQKRFYNLFNQTRDDSKTVEEERRLIYVGFTRAENSAIFNYDNDSNPLLNELKLPQSHIMGSDKYGRATPISYEAKKHRAQMLKAKIKTMQKEYQAIENDLKEEKSDGKTN